MERGQDSEEASPSRGGPLNYANRGPLLGRKSELLSDCEQRYDKGSFPPLPASLSLAYFSPDFAGFRRTSGSIRFENYERARPQQVVGTWRAAAFSAMAVLAAFLPGKSGTVPGQEQKLRWAIETWGGEMMRIRWKSKGNLHSRNSFIIFPFYLLSPTEIGNVQHCRKTFDPPLPLYPVPNEEKKFFSNFNRKNKFKYYRTNAISREKCSFLIES